MTQNCKSFFVSRTLTRKRKRDDVLMSQCICVSVDRVAVRTGKPGTVTGSRLNVPMDTRLSRFEEKTEVV